MDYIEMRSAGRVTRLRSAAAMASAVLLAACSGSPAEPTADATPAAREITAETPVEPTSPPPPPSPTPDDVPDPSDIDVAYMQEVADVFAEREGEIVRMAFEHGHYTGSLDATIRRGAGKTYQELSVQEWKQLLEDGSYRDRYEPNAAAPEWHVQTVDIESYPCVSVLADVDVTSTRLGGPFDMRQTLFAFQRSQTDGLSGWRLDRAAIGEELEGINACTAE